jgi:hypothetical protein
MTFRATTTFSIGAALRAERERLRVSLDAVERGTMIRRDFLELIDADRLDELPSGAYAKGFIRAYAAYLGLDSAPLVKAYDESFAPATSELANVVGRPVRVPPDRRRRGWKIAVAGATGVLILLGALGVFRSDSKPQSVPKLSVSAARFVSPTAPDPMGAVVRVDVVGTASWVQADADGQPVFGQTLTHGQSRTFKAKDHVVLFFARAHEVRIMANGQALGTPDASVYRGDFTPSTTEFPANVFVQAPPARAPGAGGPVTLPEQPK